MAEAWVKPGSRLAISLEHGTVPTVVAGTPQSQDMGRRLQDFEFMTGQPRRAAAPYPLEQWMDGSIWEIVRGEDFEGSPRHMQARLHHYASHRGYRVQTRCVYEPGRESVVFRYSGREQETHQ
jgi:hypothetical protein